MKFSANTYIHMILVAILVMPGTFSHAQNDSAANPKKEKKQTLNFEDELVTGSSEKPELFYLFQKKNFNYRRLIRLRENFLPEMRRTSEEVQRARGGD